MLEIDHCDQITDQAATKLVKLNNLELLSIGGTNMGTAALAELVFGLRKLKHLINADFLCDVLEYVQNDNDDIWEKGQPPPLLNVQEFYNSEVDYFHTTQQMILVNRICPDIRKIRFFYDGEETCELSVLDIFENLCELKINGGDLNKDPLRPLFEEIGHRLTKLEFNHVECFDRQFIAQLSLNCPNLVKLGFDCCSFVDYGTLYSELFDYYNEGSADGIEQIELALLLRDQEQLSNQVEEIMVPFLNLEELTMSSRCTRVIMTFMLLNIPNIVRLHLGSCTTLDDDLLEQVLEKNKFPRLETFSILGESDLTYWSLELLLEHCSNLKQIKGLPYWMGISEDERKLFETWLKEANVDLDVSEIEPVDFSLFFNRNEMDEKLVEEIRAYFSTD